MRRHYIELSAGELNYLVAHAMGYGIKFWDDEVVLLEDNEIFNQVIWGTHTAVLCKDYGFQITEYPTGEWVILTSGGVHSTAGDYVVGADMGIAAARAVVVHEHGVTFDDSVFNGNGEPPESNPCKDLQDALDELTRMPKVKNFDPEKFEWPTIHTDITTLPWIKPGIPTHCLRCGIDMKGPMGYACVDVKCPSRATANATIQLQ